MSKELIDFCIEASGSLDNDLYEALRKIPGYPGAGAFALSPVTGFYDEAEF
jgi:hypothetical protein